MNFNAPTYMYKEHLIEFFTKLKKNNNISVFFIYEKYTLSIDFYVNQMTSYLSLLKINSEKSLGKASSFT